jgi:hypothetical protein
MNTNGQPRPGVHQVPPSDRVGPSKYPHSLTLSQFLLALTDWLEPLAIVQHRAQLMAFWRSGLSVRESAAYARAYLLSPCGRVDRDCGHVPQLAGPAAD